MWEGRTSKHAAVKRAASCTETCSLCSWTNLSAQTVPSQPQTGQNLAESLLLPWQCSNRSAPGALLCISQRRRTQSAACSSISHIKHSISAQSSPLTLHPTLWSRLHAEGNKSFSVSTTERGIRVPAVKPTSPKRSKFKSTFSLHPYNEEVLARKGLWENEAVLKDGDDMSQETKKSRGVPLRELISCWMERAESMLAGSSPRLQTVESELCKVSWAVKHHAGGCERLSANGRLLLSLLCSAAATGVGSSGFLFAHFLPLLPARTKSLTA